MVMSDHSDGDNLDKGRAMSTQAQAVGRTAEAATWKSRALVGLIVLAAAAALAMNLNYHIANGATNPWQLPAEVFDAGVDINAVFSLMDATIIAVVAGVSLSPRGGAPANDGGKTEA